VIYRDPKCVFVADSLGLAEVVATWLRGQEIPAEVMNPNTLGGLLGLMPYSSTGVSATGIEVWVVDASQAPQATQLLAEQRERFLRPTEQPADAPAQIEAPCEACGKVTVFPGKDAGKVQNCKHCGAYLDVPGGDDGDWLAEAEGAEEAEDAE
jgi:hypothetical protein